MEDKLAALTLTISLFSIFYSFLKQNRDDEMFFKELFKDFNGRYDSHMNDMFNDLRSRESTGELMKTELSDSEKLIIIDYFNMCSEQYFWYTKKRILPEVWSAWEAGMLANLSLKPVLLVFNDEKKDSKSYYGFIEYISKPLSEILDLE